MPHAQCRRHTLSVVSVFSIKRWFFSFKAVFYLALMLTTVLKAELAVLFTLLTAFTL